MLQATTPVEAGNTPSYQDKLLGLLGSRDPLGVLAETPGMISRIAAEHPAKTLQTRPFPGKWTPCEIIGHLCDGEYVYAYRMRQVLGENEPTIHSMEQEPWVTGQKYNQRDPRALAEQFATLRRFNLDLWRSISKADLERAGRHSQRGRETLGLMQRMHAGHDLSHIDQITRYIGAIRA